MMPKAPGRWRVAAGLLLLLLGCADERTPAGPGVGNGDRTLRTPSRRRSRSRVAAVSIRFWNRALEPGADGAGFDQLRVAAVFADADPRDVHLVGALVGASEPGRTLPTRDSCVLEPRPGGHPSVAPVAWMQLLDVGDLALLSDRGRLPVDVSLVPSLFSGVRGVRYDAERDQSRGMLAAGRLRLQGSGGDGVGGFEASVPVPRPLRFTRVAGLPVRSGRVRVSAPIDDLELRWGSSVGGEDTVELQVGVEGERGLRWLRCRLHDDGAFTVPARLLEPLRDEDPARPWLLVIGRHVDAEIPGFPGPSLRLELLDAVRLQPTEAAPEPRRRRR
ncbi:MAG: hypothetical protein RIT45_803 [Pseudomonadota bacterium]|jgi:hypothetical protein